MPESYVEDLVLDRFADVSHRLLVCPRCCATLLLPSNPTARVDVSGTTSPWRYSCTGSWWAGSPTNPSGDDASLKLSSASCMVKAGALLAPLSMPNGHCCHTESVQVQGLGSALVAHLKVLIRVHEVPAMPARNIVVATSCSPYA